MFCVDNDKSHWQLLRFWRLMWAELEPGSWWKLSRVWIGRELKKNIWGQLIEDCRYSRGTWDTCPRASQSTQALLCQLTSPLAAAFFLLIFHAEDHDPLMLPFKAIFLDPNVPHPTRNKVEDDDSQDKIVVARWPQPYNICCMFLFFIFLIFLLSISGLDW